MPQYLQVPLAVLEDKIVTRLRWSLRKGDFVNYRTKGPDIFSRGDRVAAKLWRGYPTDYWRYQPLWQLNCFRRWENSGYGSDQNQPQRLP
jgi:hypothetical protein